MLYVEGRLEYRTFADDEGRSRGVAEIVADDVQFLDRPHTNADDGDAEALDLEEIAL